MRRLIRNRPKYEINEEIYQNQNLAKSAAFGRDRSIQIQESQLEQDAADAASRAQDVTSNASSLLSTLAAIQSNQDSARRGLAMNEAELQRQNRINLMDANQAIIDEKDKAWDFNVNQPYQNQIQALRDRKKARSQLTGEIISGLSQIITSGASSAKSFFGGG